jgi:hypothetical protein
MKQMGKDAYETIMKLRRVQCVQHALLGSISGSTTSILQDFGFSWAVKMQVEVFCVVMLCSVVVGHQCLRGQAVTRSSTMLVSNFNTTWYHDPEDDLCQHIT